MGRSFYGTLWFEVLFPSMLTSAAGDGASGLESNVLLPIAMTQQRLSVHLPPLDFPALSRIAQEEPCLRRPCICPKFHQRICLQHSCAKFQLWQHELQGIGDSAEEYHDSA